MPYNKNISGLKNEDLVKDLSISGSSVVYKPIDNIFVFDEANSRDGVVYAKVEKPKYNEPELIRSIDTRIFELIPIEPPPPNDDVPRPVYNEVTQSVIDLTAEVVRLNTIVEDLRAKVSELEIVSESLRVDVDAQKILVASFENQLNQSNLKISSTVIDLTNAIQKGTAEAIQRVSLTARNQSLKEQNDQLNEILFGKQAKQAEGARVSTQFSVKVLQKGEAAQNDLTFRGRAKEKGGGDWINGPDLEFYNFTNDPINLDFQVTGNVVEQVVLPSPFRLEPRQTKYITITLRKDKVDDLKPSAAINLRADTSYKGALICKAESSQIGVPVSIQKQSGDKWTGGN